MRSHAEARVYGYMLANAGMTFLSVTTPVKRISAAQIFGRTGISPTNKR